MGWLCYILPLCVQRPLQKRWQTYFKTQWGWRTQDPLNQLRKAHRNSQRLKLQAQVHPGCVLGPQCIYYSVCLLVGSFLLLFCLVQAKAEGLDIFFSGKIFVNFSFVYFYFFEYITIVFRKQGTQKMHSLLFCITMYLPSPGR